MSLFGYILWDVNPVLFTIGVVSPRWYGLLFALGFLIGQWVIAKIFKIENKPAKDLETLLIYMVVATVVGARLGHCLFYQPDYFLLHPWEILYVWQGGLASHGAIISILLALYFYSKKRKGQSFLWVVDRIVIVTALGGALIRFGNLMNSEIIGKPADKNYSFVFAYHLTDYLNQVSDKMVSGKKIKRLEKETLLNEVTYKAVNLEIYFDKAKADSIQAYLFVSNNLLPAMNNSETELSKHFRSLDKNPQIKIRDEGNRVTASVQVYCIPRHAAQLYEALSCLVLFFFLLWLYYQRKEKTPEGQLFAIFMIVVFGLRFFYEFLKENQVEFENSLSLNMGQILSIPAVIFALVVLYYARGKAEEKS